jgi:HEAT repeat protein
MIRHRIAAFALATFAALTPLAADVTVADFADDQQETASDRRNREQDLYDAATDALDAGEWRVAADHFREVSRMGLDNADAALYWMAYAQNKMGQRSEALTTLVDLQKRFPKSRWITDGKALEVEIRQSAGQRVAPENVNDEDLKLMAVSGLMHTDPERAFPILEKIIMNKSQSAKVRDKAIFVLSQSGSPRAGELLARLARDGSNPDLQARAIKNLGILGGENSRKLLGEVYQSSSDMKIKKSILRSYMISGDKGRLLGLARGEQNPDLRAEAVQQLGVMGAKNELAELYRTETDVRVKKKIIQAMFIGGNAEYLKELAQSEKNLELRLTAIKNLGLMGGTGQMLVSMYESDQNREVREAVINGLFLQSNGKALIGLARKEKDPQLKKEIVSKLAIMGGEDTADFLLEIINQ